MILLKGTDNIHLERGTEFTKQLVTQAQKDDTRVSSDFVVTTRRMNEATLANRTLQIDIATFYHKVCMISKTHLKSDILKTLLRRLELSVRIKLALGVEMGVEKIDA